MDVAYSLNPTVTVVSTLFNSVFITFRASANTGNSNTYDY